MTKKDYTVIVDAIGSGLNQASWDFEKQTNIRGAFSGRDLFVARLVAKSIGDTLSRRLREDNPRFNEAKFNEAIDDVVGSVGGALQSWRDSQ